MANGIYLILLLCATVFADEPNRWQDIKENKIYTNLLSLNFESELAFRTQMQQNFDRLDVNGDKYLSKSEIARGNNNKEYDFMFIALNDDEEQLDFEGFYKIVKLPFERKFWVYPDACEVYDNVTVTNKDMSSLVPLMKYQCDHGFSAMVSYEIEQCLLRSNYSGDCVTLSKEKEWLRSVSRRMSLWMVQEYFKQEYKEDYLTSLQAILRTENVTEKAKQLLSRFTNISDVTEMQFKSAVNQRAARREGTFENAIINNAATLGLNFPMPYDAIVRAMDELPKGNKIYVNTTECHLIFLFIGECDYLNGRIPLHKIVHEYSLCVTGYRALFLDRKNSEKNECLINSTSIDPGIVSFDDHESICSIYIQCTNSLSLNKRAIAPIGALMIIPKFSLFLFIGTVIVLALLPLWIFMGVRNNAIKRSQKAIQNWNDVKFLVSNSCKSVEYYWSTCGVPGTETARFCAYGGRPLSDEACLVHHLVGLKHDLICGLNSPHSSKVTFPRNETTPAEEQSLNNTQGAFEYNKLMGRYGFKCQSICIKEIPEGCSIDDQ
ncbi:hypothetical protein MP638_007099 [Amoeboaphelidium occidentale]|nr:hypothetical protein MP638_007099 [Amoeboaphelidium occidentale]